MNVPDFVRVPLQPAEVVSVRELPSAMAAAYAGELLVAQCHDVLNAKGEPLSYLQLRKLCKIAAVSSGLRPVVFGSTTKLKQAAKGSMGLHKDSHKPEGQVDAHYVTGNPGASYAGTVIAMGDALGVPDNTVDDYILYPQTSSEIYLPPHFATQVTEARYIAGKVGTITLWSGNHGWSSPHQFVNGPVLRKSTVFANS